MTSGASLHAVVDFSLYSAGQIHCEGGQKTTQSKLRRWSNRPNQNRTSLLDSSIIHGSPPNAQTCSALSAEGRNTYEQSIIPPHLEQELERSGRDDYRPIIDDLTIELRNLREELRLYKAQGPYLLRNEQLFEVKYNNLSKRKRRELEAALNIFAGSMADLTTQSKESRRRVDLLPDSGLEPLPTSSQQLKTQPSDSAYTSMLADCNSSQISLCRTASMQRTRSAKQKVEKYLGSIPADFRQTPGVMTDVKRNHWIDDCDSTLAKRQRMDYLTGDTRTVTREPKFKPQVPGPSNRFYYKPLFVHQNSPDGATVLGDTLSPFVHDDDSIGMIGYTHSGSRYPNPQNGRREGSIIYYNDAPFCVDLSGDSSDWPPAKDIAFSMENATESSDQRPHRQACTDFSASELGSWLLSNPLTVQNIIGIDEKVPFGLLKEYVEETSDAGFEFTCTEEQPQCLAARVLEPCGLGNVQPDDHFTVLATTSRSKKDACWVRQRSEQGTRVEARRVRLGRVLPSSPVLELLHQRSENDLFGNVKIEYTDVRIKHLMPVLLPQPVFFFSPSNNFDISDEHEDSSESEETCLNNAEW
ncbi:frequency clock protein [Beauveria bassiana ARSEF 2860]|uniref:Primary circadian oscillator component FRQ2 n=1 Tax=Beauveria bassiana (strain ARSEF 2860) TaxID=655819 RepID=FRQ2_BEAB2|nr:frequency clock protein [Beauveria bassiana ARSEF 2860]EJP62033.1 frequency clock protein [Beauveria bassiana ARSEF 2860]